VESVLVEILTVVESLVRSTVALGTAAPLASNTAPTMLPSEVWANAVPSESTPKSTAINTFFIFSPF